MSSRQEINSEYPESHTSSVVFMVACNASAANRHTAGIPAHIILPIKWYIFH